ncbi:MAG TPA: hypothetical protein VKJ65_07565 [Phycisphaerae bacterium]|nr:hypothetical protein [Phycisphaerae bacterium]
MTLRSDHRIEGAPSIHEHSWEIQAGKLILRDRNDQPTMEFTALGPGRYIGSDLTQSPPGKAQLILDWRSGFGATNGLLRELKFTLQPRKRPQPAVQPRRTLLENSIGLKFKQKKFAGFLPLRPKGVFMNMRSCPGFSRILPSSARNRPLIMLLVYTSMTKRSDPHSLNFRVRNFCFHAKRKRGTPASQIAIVSFKTPCPTTTIYTYVMRRRSAAMRPLAMRKKPANVLLSTAANMPGGSK